MAEGGLGWIEPALRVLSYRYFEGPPTAETSPTAWGRAVAAALTERLGPALGEAARVAGTPLPTASRALLTAARLQNARLVEAQVTALAELGSELDRRGVPAVLLKGLSLGRRYPALDLRVVSDVDLLVPRDAVRAVDEVLCIAGYRRWWQPASGPGRYAILYLRESGPLGDVVVDLHPSWHEIELVAPHVRIGPESEPVRSVDVSGQCWAALSPPAELYLTAAHAILHNPRTLSVYLDAAVLAYEASPEVFARAWVLARANGRERHLRHALSMAADLFGVTVPQQYISWFQRLGVPPGPRLGYVGRRRRYLPSSLVLELLWRHGVRRKVTFGRWVLGHRERRPVSFEGVRPVGGRRVARSLHGLRWLRGVVLRYPTPEPGDVATAPGGRVL